MLNIGDMAVLCLISHANYGAEPFFFNTFQNLIDVQTLNGVGNNNCIDRCSSMSTSFCEK